MLCSGVICGWFTTQDRGKAPLVRRFAVLLIAAALIAGGCSDEGDDLVPTESERGEDDAEIVPGEGGPVD